MAILEIVLYPTPSLKEPSEPVELVDNELLALLEDMAETMYDAPGIGLAAPQVGKNIRAIVVDVGNNEETGRVAKLYKLINPEIVSKSGNTLSEEGCLSIPDVREKVKRAEKVTVKALNEKSQEITIEADGMLAICLQHEIDHLDGVLFIDRLSPVRRQLVKNKLEKLKKK